MSEPVRIAVYGDCLCPWCYVAAYRFKTIKQEYGDEVAISWKSYPLRRGGGSGGSLLHSNEGRRRAAAEEPGIRIGQWPDGLPMPSSSFPALEAASAARLQGYDAFERFHLAVMHAYFALCLDVSEREVLLALAGEAGLDVERFRRDLDNARWRELVLADFNEYNQEHTGWGVPTAVFGDDIVLAGAVPLAMYRSAIAAARRRG